MLVYPNGYFCERCKTFLPSRKERGRAALLSELRAGGFFLLLLASLFYSMFGEQSMLVWVGFLAGYSFYFLTILQSTKEMLLH